jgi:hypothetical protein
MKLHEGIALRKGEVGREKGALTGIYQLIQKPVLFEGMSKTYEPVDEGGEKLPAENVRVQQNVRDLIAAIRGGKTTLWNTCALVDYGNMLARGNITVDGQAILSDVPVTTLLFLETQLTDLRTIVEKLPVLSPDFAWSEDANSGLFKTDMVQTHRNRKLMKPVVLYHATEKHPAQTQMVEDTILAGYWNQVKMSGAIPATRKAVLVGRIETLLDAVKTARARANDSDVNKVDVARPLFDFIFA